MLLQGRSDADAVRASLAELEAMRETLYRELTGRSEPEQPD